MRFTLTLDSSDPEPLAKFWAAALGYTSLGEFGVFWPLAPADDNEPPLIIQRVAEPKVGKNRMHLDLHVTDLASEVGRLAALGATRISADVIAEHDHRWLVMADPDGNEFCVVQRPG
jgi:predicted enzyme related to lactoylglutathione lyase